MSYGGGPKFILPTYQSLLNAALHAVVSRLNERDYFGAWEALQTLHRICIPSVKKKLTEDFQNIIDQIAKASIVGLGSDRILTKNTQNKRLLKILRVGNHNLLDRCVTELYLEGLLVKLPRKVEWGSDEETKS